LFTSREKGGRGPAAGPPRAGGEAALLLRAIRATWAAALALRD
jgi:hypothetical protein